MGKENTMQRLHAAQKDSRVDKLSRIQISSSGRRYGIQVRTGTTKMKVPFFRLSFIKKTKKERALSCQVSFYITGKALVVKSMEWAHAGAQGVKRKEILVDADACELIVQTLKEIAVRHKVPSIYADQNDVPRAILMNLGFSSMGSHDFMHLDVSQPEQKH